MRHKLQFSVAIRAKRELGITSICVFIFLLFCTQALADRSPAVSLRGTLLESSLVKVTVKDLEKLPLTTYKTYNPFAKARREYTGVLLKTVVGHYAKAGTNRVVLTAFDDYEVDFTMEEWLKWDILLATRSEGEYMPVKDQGPVKIILPYDDAPDIDQKEYNRKWIWMIKSMRFEIVEGSR